MAYLWLEKESCRAKSFMFMTFQTTIQQPAESCRYRSAYGRTQARIRLVPAPADTGVVFRRVDLDNFTI